MPVGRPFQAGQSGNPGGRPKGPSLKTALMRELARKDESGRRNVDAIAAALVEKAKAGNVEAIREILDRVDGKVPTPPMQIGMGGYDGGPLRVATYDYHVAVAAIAAGPEPDRLAPVEAQVSGDGPPLGEDRDGG